MLGKRIGVPGCVRECDFLKDRGLGTENEDCLEGEIRR